MCDDQSPIEVIDRVGIDSLVCLYEGKPGNNLNNLQYRMCFAKEKSPPGVESANTNVIGRHSPVARD